MTGSVERYYFDKAVWMFGSAMQRDLEEAEEYSGKTAPSKSAIRSKKIAVMQKWMPSSTPTGTQGRYKDPALGKF